MSDMYLRRTLSPLRGSDMGASVSGGFRPRPSACRPFGPKQTALRRQPVGRATGLHAQRSPYSPAQPTTFSSTPSSGEPGNCSRTHCQPVGRATGLHAQRKMTGLRATKLLPRATLAAASGLLALLACSTNLQINAVQRRAGELVADPLPGAEAAFVGDVGGEAEAQVQVHGG